MTTQSVQVKLELGHRATIRDKQTLQGFTHDWLVFVRGPEGSNIQHFVDKVVFQLHESFPKPRRVVKEPPYEVAESGYAGFLMTIEVHFRSKEEPKKVILNYDLFLNTEQQPPVNHIRCEKLTFHNPTEDFRRKLLKAGGVGIHPTDPGVPTSPPSTTPNYPVTEGGVGGKPLSSSFTDTVIHAKGKPQAVASSSLQASTKKYKTQAPKDGSKTSKPLKEHKEGKTASKEPKVAKEPKTSSKDPKTVHSKEAKTATKEIKASSKEPKSNFKEPKPGPKENKTSSKEAKTIGAKEPKSSSKDAKTQSKLTAKEPKASSKEAKTSPKPPAKEPSRTKQSVKRPASTSPAPTNTSQDSNKKRKRSNSIKEKDSNEKGPSNAGKPSPAEKSTSQSSKVSKEKSARPKTVKAVAAVKPTSISRNDSNLFTPEIKKVSSKAPITELPRELPPFEDELSTGECGEPHSPSSSISFSSLPRGGGGVLNTLMAELGDENDDDDDDDELKTPSPVPLLPPPLSNHSTSSNEQDYNKHPPVAPQSQDKTKNAGQKSSKKSNGSKKAGYSSSSGGKNSSKQKSGDGKQKSVDAKQKESRAKVVESSKQKSSEAKTTEAKMKHSEGVKRSGNDAKAKPADSKSLGYLNDLILLHQKLSCLQNREQLQQVVNLIEETGMFRVTDATFDFDLCSLDQITLKKLQECVALVT